MVHILYNSIEKWVKYFLLCGGRGGRGIKLQEFDKLNEIKVNYINEKKFKFLRKT